MVSGKRADGKAQVGEQDLRSLSQSLLRAIEAEPVPEHILQLARQLALALHARAEGAEPVRPTEAQDAGEAK